jgi:hypothetical protein
VLEKLWSRKEEAHGDLDVLQSVAFFGAKTYVILEGKCGESSISLCPRAVS